MAAYTSLDMSSIRFKPPRKGVLGKGLQVFFDSSETGTRVAIQLPQMTCLGGLEQNAECGWQNGSIRLLCPDDFADWWSTALEGLIKDTAVSRMDTWFGHTHTEEQIRGYFRSAIWQEIEGPTLKLFLSYRAGNCTTGIFDSNGCAISPSRIKPGERVACIVELDKLVLAGGSFSLRMNLIHVKCYGVDPEFAPVTDDFAFDIEDDDYL